MAVPWQGLPARRAPLGVHPYTAVAFLIRHSLSLYGRGHLCVAHRSEYILISIRSGTVRELFRFASDYGDPFLQRLSDGGNEYMYL